MTDNLNPVTMNTPRCERCRAFLGRNAHVCPRRFPFAPLEHHFRLTHRPATNHNGAAQDETASVVELAHLIGVNRSHLYTWKNEGVPRFAADRVAIALDTHPVLLWSDYYDDLDTATFEVAE